MMKKILIPFLLALLLTGCKTIADIRPDTIVDIPLHPTEVQTAAPTELATVPAEAVTEPEETEPVTEVPEPTQSAIRPPQSSGSAGTTSGSKKPGKGTSGSSKPQPTTAPTEPATQPPTEAPTQAPTQPPAYDPSGYSPGSLDYAVCDEINARRQEEGMEPLSMDKWLCAIASVRAYESFVNWDHLRPDGSPGITVLREYGYGYACAAENLYFGAAGAASIVEKWMTSEERRDNILSADFDTIGVGSYAAPDGLTYVAVLFVG